jgi:hypothetical protein
MGPLNALLQHDENKKYLITNAHLIDTYMSALRAYNETDEEYQLAIEGLCLCSFTKVGVSKMKRLDGCVEC